MFPLTIWGANYTFSQNFDFSATVIVKFAMLWKSGGFIDSVDVGVLNKAIYVVIKHGGISIWIDISGCENILEGLIGLITMMEGRREGLEAGNSLAD